MKQVTIEQKLAMLPEALKLKAEGYIDALLTLNETKQVAYLTSYEDLNNEKDWIVVRETQPEYRQTNLEKREFGGLKGFVTYMSDDFDSPLDDFKDYM